jgi:hypothetical protein
MPDTHKGSCHCGAVAYETTGEVEAAIECNCSHCRRKGLLLAFVQPDAFTLVKGEGALDEYRFNTRKIAHLTCKTCGVESFARGEGPKGPMVAINLRTLEGFDRSRLKVTAWDGASR